MVFSSIVFLFYFLPLFLAAFLLSGFSKYALLLFSLVFYAWGEPVFLPLILLMIALNFWFGRAIERGHGSGRARFWVTAGIVVNLLPLAIFKYGVFLLPMLLRVARPIARLLHVAPDQLIVNSIPLPLGISNVTGRVTPD